MKAHDYFLRHSEELSEKYPGKYIAMVNQELVAVSSSGHEAFEKAKKEYTDKEIYIAYMPEEETITLL